MSRSTDPRIWPVPMGFAAFAFVAGIVVAWDDVRLNRSGRSVVGRFIEVRRGTKGPPFGIYGYTVDGRRYKVSGTLTDDPAPQIDVLPSDPTVARLHDDAEKDIGIAEIGPLFGLIPLILSLGLLHEDLRLRALGKKLNSQGAIPKRR